MPIPSGNRSSFHTRLIAKKRSFRELSKRMLPKALRSEGKARYLVAYVAATAGIFAVLAMVAVYFAYFHSLPAIEEIERDVLPESTVIYDRNGGELYKLYDEEKRTYVSYEGISPKIREAIVAAEDKTFFENPGVDLKGLIRSGLNFAFGKTERIQGTSTISQQLIKNTFLSNERSLERKMKEVYLSYRLNSKYSKEKILELYLNKISFGNNAYGVEEAAKTYFGKSAKDVGVLGATILASIPKGPTYYSPYSHRDRLMGYLYAYSEGGEKEPTYLDTQDRLKEYAPHVDAFKSFVTNLSVERASPDTAKVCGLDQGKLKRAYRIDGGCAKISYSDLLSLLNDIRISPEHAVSGSGNLSQTGTSAS